MLKKDQTITPSNQDIHWNDQSHKMSFHLGYTYIYNYIIYHISYLLWKVYHLDMGYNQVSKWDAKHRNLQFAPLRMWDLFYLRDGGMFHGVWFRSFPLSWRAFVFVDGQWKSGSLAKKFGFSQFWSIRGTVHVCTFTLHAVYMSLCTCSHLVGPMLLINSMEQVVLCDDRVFACKVYSPAIDI